MLGNKIEMLFCSLGICSLVRKTDKIQESIMKKARCVDTE